MGIVCKSLSSKIIRIIRFEQTSAGQAAYWIVITEQTILRFKETSVGQAASWIVITDFLRKSMRLADYFTDSYLIILELWDLQFFDLIGSESNSWYTEH